MGTCTSKQNQIALEYNKIKEANKVIEKALKTIDLILNPPKENPDPHYWYSVEEVAKKLFNWTEENLFIFMQQQGWIYRSGNNAYWLGKAELIDAKLLRHKARQLPTGENYCQILISEYGEVELLRVRSEKEAK